MPSLRRCPWSQLSDEVWLAYTWWSDWKSFNILPWGGTDLVEEPAYVLEVIQLCEGIRNSVEKEKYDEQNKKLERERSKLKRRR